MKYLRKIGLGLSIFLVFLGLSLAVSSQNAYADDLADLNDFGGGQAAKDKLIANTTINVVNQAQIDVKVNLQDLIYRSQASGSQTWGDAFSGSYVDTNTGDDTYRWEGPKFNMYKRGGDVSIDAKGIISSSTRPPLPSASASDVATWASNLVIVFEVRLEENNAGDEEQEFGDPALCDSGAWSSDCNEVLSLQGFNITNIEAIKMGYAYIGRSISRLDGRKTYSFNSNPTTEYKNYFQQSSGGELIFFNDPTSINNWDTITEPMIRALFDCETCTGYFDASIGADGSGAAPIRIAQSKNTGGGILDTGGGDADIDINCEWSVFNPLTWFLCPLIEGGAQVITALDAEINERLIIEVGEGSNFDENRDNGKGLYSAWSSMRTIGLSLLVLIALIMVISQALSAGPFDAYTVKKVLPRIVISVIAISLSWQICRLLIGISNDFGQGVSTILSRPFESIGNNPTVDFTDGSSSALGTIGTIAALFSGLDLLAVGSFLLVGLAAVFIALIVIAFRSILITLLVMTAPLALILWILPNTQKGWKLWKDNFTAVLLAFPIITAFLVSGRIFSKIASNSGGGLFYNIIVFLAYFGPYFALPIAFRLAGGFVAQVGGIANDRSKGFFDRNKKFRAGRIASNKAKEAGFSRFSDRNAFGRRANRVLGGGRAIGRDPKKMLRSGSFNAARQTGQATYAADALKNDPTNQAHGQDDNFLVALADENLATQMIAEDRAKLADQNRIINDGTRTDTERRDAREKANSLSASVAAREKGLAAARQVGGRKTNAVRLAAINNLAKTGYQFAQGEEGYRQLSNAVRSVVGNDDGAYSAAMDEAQYHLKTAQRFDLAGINHGAGYDAKTGTDKASLYELANAKKESIAALTSTIPQGPITQSNGADASVIYKELTAMLPNAKGGNRDKIAAEIENLEARGIKQFMSLDSGRTEQVPDPATGLMVARPKQKTVRENFDSRAGVAAATAAGWTPQDINLGYRTITRNETNEDIAQEKARTYERPDPNKIN